MLLEMESLVENHISPIVALMSREDLLNNSVSGRCIIYI